VFWQFLTDHAGLLTVDSEEKAAQAVRDICGVDSRSKLDTNEEAEAKFHVRIRLPFIDFMNQQER
jgi:hypothetical protein